LIENALLKNLGKVIDYSKIPPHEVAYMASLRYYLIDQVMVERLYSSKSEYLIRKILRKPVKKIHKSRTKQAFSDPVWAKPELEP
jgi:hypothetical protein